MNLLTDYPLFTWNCGFRRGLFLLTAIVLFSWGMIPGIASAQSFELLNVPGDYTPIAVSPDGSTAWFLAPNRQTLLRWTLGGGIETFETGLERVWAVSEEGVAVGNWSSDTLGVSAQWTPGSGVQVLDVEYADYVEATAVSSRGSVVAGKAFLGQIDRNGYFEIVPTGGFRLAGSNASRLGEEEQDVEPQGISRDGSVVAGRWVEKASVFGDTHSAFWWSAAGFSDLGRFGNETVVDFFPTPDGEMGVGTMWLESDTYQPFRWSEAAGYKPLDIVSTPYENGVGAGVTSASLNGRVIVGVWNRNVTSPDGSAALWTQGQARDLSEVLADDYGLIFYLSLKARLHNQFEVGHPRVSADGSTIFGVGQDYSGERVLWRAVLVPQLIVNSTADRPDISASDNRCDTGFTVTTDMGETLPECTLRAAIEEANARGGGTINFDIEADGVPAIDIESALPTLEYAITLDGSTQEGGWVELVGPTPRGTEGSIMHGVLIGKDGGGSVVRGFIIHSFHGSLIRTMPGADRCLIEGNRLGTDVTGTKAMGSPPQFFYSILYGNVSWSAPVYDRWGGVRLGSNRTIVQDNIIAGNYNYLPELENAPIEDQIQGGVDITIDPGTNGNIVRRNRIGIGADGSRVPVRNSPSPFAGEYFYIGLWIEGEGHLIGGAGGDGNMIGGHDIEIVTRSFPHRIIGNQIGLPDGEDIGYDGALGIFLTSGEDEAGELRGRVEDNDIRSADVGISSEGGYDIVGNKIESQGRAWIPQFEGDARCGTSHAVTLDSGDMFKGNTVNSKGAWAVHAVGKEIVVDGNDLVGKVGSICVADAENLQSSVLITRNNIMSDYLGIELAEVGVFNYAVSLNDISDVDVGPNGLLNFPVPLQVTRSNGDVRVEGVLWGAYSGTTTVEVFGNARCGRTTAYDFPYGPGEKYLGAVEVTPGIGDFGEPAFEAVVGGFEPEYKYVTLTASRADLGVTSEFSRCVPIVDASQTARADIEAGQTGVLLAAQDAVTEATEVAKTHEAALRTNHEGGTLYLTRYEAAPDSGSFADTLATAPDGFSVHPDAVAPTSWLLKDRHLTPEGGADEANLVFRVCLRPGDLVVDPGRVVLVQRNIATEGLWMPRDTEAVDLDGESYLCAAGLEGLGEFSFGGTEATLPTSFQEPEREVPNRISLDQNYPNPFNPSTVIPYSLPEATHVKLEVYDMAGRKIATLLDSSMPAGQHEIVFNAGNLASGVYIIRMEAGLFSSTQKMLLMK